jgi:hypothetical protein
MTFGSFLKQAANVVGDVLEEQTKQQRNNTSSAGSARDGEDLDDGANIPLSTCDGNKKSLFIGINYIGSRAELRGCINDVVNIKKFVVENWHFPTDEGHMKTLTDDNPQNMPTRENIIEGFKWLVQGAKTGNSLFINYSGHGGSQKDTDPNTDEVDGMDETLVPVDYKKSGMIVDDDLHALLVADLPAGVRLTAIMDCCHSGSVFDLPFTYSPDGNLEIHEVDNRKAAINAAMAAGMSWIKGDKAGKLTSGIRALSLYAQPDQKPNDESKQRQIKIRSAVADVIQFLKNPKLLTFITNSSEITRI